MEVQDPETIKFYSQKCFDTCIDSFKHKLLTPHEQECFRTCLKNVRSLHIEMVHGQQHYEKFQRESKQPNAIL